MTIDATRRILQRQIYVDSSLSIFETFNYQEFIEQLKQREDLLKAYGVTLI